MTKEVIHPNKIHIYIYIYMFLYISKILLIQGIRYGYPMHEVALPYGIPRTGNNKKDLQETDTRTKRKRMISGTIK